MPQKGAPRLGHGYLLETLSGPPENSQALALGSHLSLPSDLDPGWSGLSQTIAPPFGIRFPRSWKACWKGCAENRGDVVWMPGLRKDLFSAFSEPGAG